MGKLTLVESYLFKTSNRIFKRIFVRSSIKNIHELLDWCKFVNFVKIGSIVQWPTWGKS